MSNQNEKDPSCLIVRAKITKVMEEYVVAYPLKDCGDLTTRDSVTFPLSRWGSSNEPECGQVVDLDGTSLYMGGWRAYSACPVTPYCKMRAKRS